MNVCVHDIPAFDAFCARRKIDPYRVRRFRNALYKQGKPTDDAFAELPRGDEIAREVTAHPLRLAHRVESAHDRATRLVFETQAGHHIESVILRIKTGRTSLCISSQIGCAQNCHFCATGKMGIAKNLTVAEILDQVVQANQLLMREEHKRLRNVVFMGMGEPLANERNLHDALDALISPRGFDLSPRHVLVSTVGLAEPLVRLARRFRRISLALSLHSAIQDTRQRIMPIARRYTLDDLRAALETLQTLRDREIMIEYLTLRGVNDSIEDAEALIRFLDGLNVMVNLIPYNRIAEAPDLDRSRDEDYQAFYDYLKAAGLQVTRRYSLGQDVAAACGQLIKQYRKVGQVDPASAS